MSRSVRKTPKCGAASHSDKKSKQAWHRKMRSKCRIVFHCIDVDSFQLPEVREVSDVWLMAKDGKIHFDPVEWRKACVNKPTRWRLEKSHRLTNRGGRQYETPPRLEGFEAAVLKGSALAPKIMLAIKNLYRYCVF